MTPWKFKKLKTKGFDFIKEEYMKGKYGDLTDKQLELVLERCSTPGRGGVCLRKKNAKNN